MNRIKVLLTDIFGISENKIQGDNSLENMGLDSICIVEFQIEIERAFNIAEGRLALVDKDTLQTIMERVRGLLPAELKGT
jgi:acyl carrier protein